MTVPSLLKFIAVFSVALSFGFNARAEEAITYDVLVYGATPGGITAAIAAAREGMKVALVEPTQQVGGMISGGLNATDLKKVLAIGGLEKEYYDRTAQYYREKYGENSDQLIATTFYEFSPDGKLLHQYAGVKTEPSVGERLFEEMLKAEPNLTVERGLNLTKATVDGSRIQTANFEKAGGGEVTLGAKVFIDATYCGDLMAAAGVTSRIGIEGRAEYNESLAPGKAAKEVQAYSYRITLTSDPNNQVAIEKPENYDTENLDFQWALNRNFPATMAKNLEKIRTTKPSKHSHWNVLPNQKFDANLVCFHGVNWEYPEADAKTRESLDKLHRDFYLSYLYFVQHDERVPKEAREEYLKWGLPRDEFIGSGHFPDQLYIREGRRLVGEYVIVQQDIDTNLRKPDSIGIGDYSFDSKGTQVTRDKAGKFTWRHSFEKHLDSAYEIPFRSLYPKRGEVSNLLVPVCLSSSQIAWSSLRMEPVFMRTGEASGVAAAIAVKKNEPVQDVDPVALRERLKALKAIVDLDVVTK